MTSRGRALAGPGSDHYEWYSEVPLDDGTRSGTEGSGDGEQALLLFKAGARSGPPAATYAIARKDGVTVWVYGAQSAFTPAKWRQGAGGAPERAWVVPVLAVAGGLLLLYLLSD